MFLRGGVGLSSTIAKKKKSNNIKGICFPGIIKELTVGYMDLGLTPPQPHHLPPHKSAHSGGVWGSDYSRIKSCLVADVCSVIE